MVLSASSFREQRELYPSHVASVGTGAQVGVKPGWAFGFGAAGLGYCKGPAAPAASGGSSTDPTDPWLRAVCEWRCAEYSLTVDGIVHTSRMTDTSLSCATILLDFTH